MAQIVGQKVTVGDAIVDYDDKVFPDHQAQPGEKAFVFFHCVPFESSASLVNLLTATRIRRKGFDTSIVLFGPGSLLVADTRGYPKVGDEGFPGNLTYNKQLRQFHGGGRQGLRVPILRRRALRDARNRHDGRRQAHQSP